MRPWLATVHQEAKSTREEDSWARRAIVPSAIYRWPKGHSPRGVESGGGRKEGAIQVCDNRVDPRVANDLPACFSRISAVARAKMNLSVGAPILCVLLAVLLSETAHARPTRDWLLSRQKRLSDQRLAELETLLALQNVKGVVVPVGFGKVNPAVLGRKRRSISEDNLRKLHHLLLLIARDAESTADQSDQIRPLPWKEDPRQEQRDYQLI